jgi:hypothetical protein
MAAKIKDAEDSRAPGGRGCLKSVVGVGLGLALGALVGIIVGLLLGVGIALALGIL